MQIWARKKGGSTIATWAKDALPTVIASATSANRSTLTEDHKRNDVEQPRTNAYMARHHEAGKLQTEIS